MFSACTEPNVKSRTIIIPASKVRVFTEVFKRRDFSLVTPMMSPELRETKSDIQPQETMEFDHFAWTASMDSSKWLAEANLSQWVD